MSKISEIDIKSLMARGDSHEKASIESAFLLIQLSGHGDTFASSLREHLAPKSKLPPSPWQAVETDEMRLDHAAYTNLLKVMETTTLYAMNNMNITRQTYTKKQGGSYSTGDMLLQPNAFQSTISTIGAWSKWVGMIKASDKVNELLNDVCSELKSTKDATQEMQIILDRSRKTVELDEEKKLALSLSLEKNLTLNRTKGLAFTPSF